MFGRLKVMGAAPASYAKGSENISPTGSIEGAVLVSLYSPAYYEAVKADRVFIYNMLSQAILLSATTGNVPTIVNPASSGRNFVPLALRVAWISTAYTAGALAWAISRNVGSTFGTGAPIPTLTQVAQINARVGVNTNNTSKMIWSPTTNTFTAAPVVFAATGIGHVLTAVDTVDNVVYNGEIVIEPGNALSLVYTVTTMTSLVTTTIWGYEPDC